MDQLTFHYNIKWRITTDKEVDPVGLRYYKHSVGAKYIRASWKVMYGINLVYLMECENI